MARIKTADRTSIEIIKCLRQHLRISIFLHKIAFREAWLNYNDNQLKNSKDFSKKKYSMDTKIENPLGYPL